MSATEPVSAVVVRVPLPARLLRLRAERDWAASVGVPPHVTVLFPFLPAAQLVPAVRRELARIAQEFEPFDVRFERVGRFPRVVYLAPEPAARFTALTEAVHARWPGYPPYEGAFATVIPHLTITEPHDVEPEEAALEATAVAAARELPFSVPVSHLEVLVEGHDGGWRRRWRLRLGAVA